VSDEAIAFVEDGAVIYHRLWTINNLDYMVSGGLPIDHTIFGSVNKTYTIDLNVKMTPSGARYWLLWDNRWRRHLRRSLPGWRKPQRSIYPASKHRRNK
jgi:hypothetical protein